MSPKVINIVEKFIDEEFLDQEWVLPPEAAGALYELFEDGIFDSFPMTTEIAAIVQQWVDQPIDVDSGSWFLTAYLVSDGQPVA